MCPFWDTLWMLLWATRSCFQGFMLFLLSDYDKALFYQHFKHWIYLPRTLKLRERHVTVICKSLDSRMCNWALPTRRSGPTCILDVRQTLPSNIWIFFIPLEAKLPVICELSVTNATSQLKCKSALGIRGIATLDTTFPIQASGRVFY